MEREIVLADILTPQEHMFMGSSPIFEPVDRDQWYIPDGVLCRRITLEEAIEQRNKKGFITSGVMASVLRLFDKSIAISLEEIDKTTGKTQGDPKILGLWDGEKKEIVSAIDGSGKPRDLTRELYDKFKKEGLENDLHFRIQPGEEGQNSSLGEGNGGFKI